MNERHDMRPPDGMYFDPFASEANLKLRSRVRRAFAVPTPTARTVPSGHPMPDGWQSLLTIGSGQAAIQLWERQIKPGGFDVGMIDTSTMFSSQWRTKWPKHLITHEDITAECGYDPDVLPTIVARLGVPDTGTLKFPDGTTMAVYGALSKFEPGELKEGEFPMATLTFSPMSWDPTNQVEAGPAFALAAGT